MLAKTVSLNIATKFWIASLAGSQGRMVWVSGVALGGLRCSLGWVFFLDTGLLHSRERMKYILDFDRTLFDADALLADLEKDQVDFSQLGPEVLEGRPSEQYLYPDALEFLRTKNREDVYILTALSTRYGDRILEFQKAKVEQEPILSLVQEMKYTEREKGDPARDIAKQFSQSDTVVFVDDVLANCLAVKAALPKVKCFLLVRDRDVVGDILSERGIPIVHTLAEVDAQTAGL